ncbi:MAG TPA: diguanylate cyclase [Thermoanaerobaculia bacterium]|jgi:diguanylate cyclase (GGDEF)-like protein
MDRRRSDSDEVTPSPYATRVLIVDDDDHFRAYVASLMTRLDCEVTEARNGEEGLALVARGGFDLLLSDREMPLLDGMALIAQVRASPITRDMYAVMITSYDDVESKVAALTAGYDDFLPKGCSEVEVTARIVAARRILSRQRTLGDAVRQWHTIATRDDLTNVATRRIFNERAEECLRSGHEVAVALIDLDDFKRVNDTHGHLMGDRILRDVGALFLRRTRHQDLIARYGGDEFVLLMTNVSLEEGTVVAERLAVEIGTLEWEAGTTPVSIGATTGIAHSSLLEERTVDRLVDAADRALYAKKWLRKHPHAADDSLYHYPAANAIVVELPLTEHEQRLRRENEQG